MSHLKKWGILILAVFFLGLDFPKLKTRDEPAIQDFQKGILHLNAREYALAREFFYSALSKKPDFSIAKYFLFQNYYQSGDWLASQEILRELKQENPNDPLIQERWNFLLREMSGTEQNKAEKVFFHSIRGDENRGYRFRNPVDVFQDQNGNLYVLGFQTTNLLSFTPSFEPRWNTKGGFFQKMKGPVSMYSWKENILVADFPSDSLFLFNLNGKFINRYGGTGSSPDQLRGPTAVTRDTKGNFYISDSGNQRILKWNSEFKPMFEFGTKGEGKLLNPVNLTWHNDKLYVADKDASRIVIFDEEGNYLNEIRSPYFKKLRNIRFIQNTAFVTCESSGLLIQEGDEWNKFSPFRDKSGKVRTFEKPFGVSSDKYGYFYVADYSRHRIDIFTPRAYVLSNLLPEIDQIDSSDFPNIHIYLRLRNKFGQNITGLSRKEFLLTENQNVKKYFDTTDMKKYNKRLTTILVFENSKETIENANLLRDWFEPFFQNITRSDNISLIRSGYATTTILKKTYSLYDIFYNIRRSSPESRIHSGKAIYHAINQLSKELGARSLIYIGSGNYPLVTGQFNLSRIVQFAKANGIAIFPVFVNPPDKDDDSWESLATETGGTVYLLTDSSEQLYRQSMENKDYRYVISYKTETLKDLSGRWIPLEIQVNYRNYGGKALGGYFVP